MSDLISRQDAIEAVEAKAKWFNGDAIEDRCKRDAFISVIDDVLTELPSADRPTWECKDCTHWDKLDYEAPRQGWCYQFEEFTDADEYCSRCAKMRGESDE